MDELRLRERLGFVVTGGWDVDIDILTSIPGFVVEDMAHGKVSTWDAAVALLVFARTGRYDYYATLRDLLDSLKEGEFKYYTKYRELENHLLWLEYKGYREKVPEDYLLRLYSYENVRRWLERL